MAHPVAFFCARSSPPPPRLFYNDLSVLSKQTPHPRHRRDRGWRRQRGGRGRRHEQQHQQKRQFSEIQEPNREEDKGRRPRGRDG